MKLVMIELMDYDAIACCSGDGILYEIINGLMKRQDHSTAIKIPLAIIPAGSGNGLAASISIVDYFDSAIRIIHGLFVCCLFFEYFTFIFNLNKFTNLD